MVILDRTPAAAPEVTSSPLQRSSLRVPREGGWRRLQGLLEGEKTDQGGGVGVRRGAASPASAAGVNGGGGEVGEEDEERGMAVE